MRKESRARPGGEDDTHALQVDLGVSTTNELTIINQLLPSAATRVYRLRGTCRSRASPNAGSALVIQRIFLDNSCSDGCWLYRLARTAGGLAAAAANPS